MPFSPDYRKAFDRRHGRLYGYANPARATEVVNVRVTAAGVTDKPKLPFSTPRRAMHSEAGRPRAAAGSPAARVAVRVLPLGGCSMPGARRPGPAVITGGEATVVIPPGFRFHVDGFGNVIAQA